MFKCTNEHHSNSNDGPWKRYGLVEPGTLASACAVHHAAAGRSRCGTVHCIKLQHHVKGIVADAQ